MNRAQERALEELFQRAIDLPRDQREAFVAREGANDAEVAAELRALLREDDEGTKALLRAPWIATLAGLGARRTPGSDSDARELARVADEPLPERIGAYRVLEKIGQGGMGSVYLAQQDLPIRRKVALKVVRSGMASAQVLARFDAEREALARLTHPNIARVYDGGAIDAGRPYFVMEHVPGVPITTFCEREKLSLDERLALFVPVCDALHHAHERGVVHRDLKPSNVLVMLQDGHPVPKVIDFGIARSSARSE